MIPLKIPGKLVKKPSLGHTSSDFLSIRVEVGKENQQSHRKLVQGHRQVSWFTAYFFHHYGLMLLGVGVFIALELLFYV